MNIINTIPYTSSIINNLKIKNTINKLTRIEYYTIINKLTERHYKSILIRKKYFNKILIDSNYNITKFQVYENDNIFVLFTLSIIEAYALKDLGYKVIQYNKPELIYVNNLSDYLI